jgi:hypothetical protein
MLLFVLWDEGQLVDIAGSLLTFTFSCPNSSRSGASSVERCGFSKSVRLRKPQKQKR